MERDAPKNPDHRAHPGLHAIALVEMGKGALALLAAGTIATFGAARIDEAIDRLAAVSHFDAIHRALSAVAREINPASVHLVVAAVVAYGALRLAEGWGLWHAQAWASWLGAVSVALYLPFEVFASVRHPGWIAFTVLAVNLAVLWILTRDLLGRRKTSRTSSARDTHRE
ncbi:MAG: DUF2127 domain-containing protein [Lysobacter sp.]|nr:DUF2127 domain-containing protein [Lysobacter sp.]